MFWEFRLGMESFRMNRQLGGGLPTSRCSFYYCFPLKSVGCCQKQHKLFFVYYFNGFLVKLPCCLCPKPHDPDTTLAVTSKTPFFSDVFHESRYSFTYCLLCEKIDSLGSVLGIPSIRDSKQCCTLVCSIPSNQSPAKKCQ